MLPTILQASPLVNYPQNTRNKAKDIGCCFIHQH